MYKEIVLKLLKNQPINQNEFSEFIVEYIRRKKNKEINSQELAAIKQLIQMGPFNLEYAVKEAAQELNLQICTVTDIATNKVLRVDVYDE